MKLEFLRVHRFSLILGRDGSFERKRDREIFEESAETS